MDALVAGVCDSLQSAHLNAPLNIVFRRKDHVNPKVPLLIEDDSKVVCIVAKKVKSEKTYYTVKVEPEKNEA